MAMRAHQPPIFGTFMTSRHRATWAIRTIFILAISGAAHAQLEPYQKCHETFQGIINGSLALGTLDNVTIWESGYLYTGAFQLLDPTYPRDNIITPTYLGCVKVCAPGAQLNTPASALGLVATWIFPLAILLSLPYESLKEKRFRGTVSAILNWLGSPQTALTATIHNFELIRKCRRAARKFNDQSLGNDIYYVLSVFNQFDLPNAENEDFMETLIYGLFRPLADGLDNHRVREEIGMTKAMLSALAFQIRMLRRRAVIPTMANMGLFLAAFVMSVVLGFADVGDSTTVSPLILGLLFGWLPILVMFTIVDRNAVSSLRTSTLMSRWLYNVEAIRNHSRSTASPPSEETLSPPGIKWWKPKIGYGGKTNDEKRFEIGHFIGQGRRMQSSGPTAAILEIVVDPRDIEHCDINPYNALAKKVIRSKGRRPTQWYATAILSLAMVWSQILTATMISYNTPTVGLGCWTAGHLTYGTLSSVSWIVQMFTKKPRLYVRIACHVVNALALCFLITFVILVLTGGFNNCFCMSNFGGYMNFENAKFYLQFCNVQRYWIGATVIGGLVPFGGFVVAILGWLECQQLWAANEDRCAQPDEPGMQISRDWLD